MNSLFRTRLEKLETIAKAKVEKDKNFSKSSQRLLTVMDTCPTTKRRANS